MRAFSSNAASLPALTRPLDPPGADNRRGVDNKILSDLRELCRTEPDPASHLVAVVCARSCSLALSGEPALTERPGLTSGAARATKTLPSTCAW